MVRVVRKDEKGRFYILDNHGRRMYWDDDLITPRPHKGERLVVDGLLHDRFFSSAWASNSEDGSGFFGGHFYRIPTLQSIAAVLDAEQLVRDTRTIGLED
jgi:hypothetical protein